MTRHIRFNSPYVGREEADAARKAVASLDIVGNSLLGQRAEAMLRDIFKTRHALLTTSCTHALELAMMSIGVKPGDEVICPSFTFVSTANAVIRQGARPVFAEIDEGTLNIDVSDMRKRITRRTKAIVPVHYAGIGCDMDSIMAVARSNKLVVVEDAAHAIGAKYKNKFLGTIGHIGCFSFHATKNITSGEGGAFLTSHEEYYKNAEIAREKGTNRAAYLKGEIDKYSWVSEGSSYVLSDVSAAILIEQLKKIGGITRRRKEVFDRYLNGLKALEREGKIRLPEVSDACDINGHIFYFRLHTEKERDRCIKELKRKGIETTFHFVPLHTSPYGRKMLGYKKGDFPITEKVSKTLLRLPIYPQLSRPAVDFIVDSVLDVLK